MNTNSSSHSAESSSTQENVGSDMSESDTARLANMSEKIVNTTVEAEQEGKKQRRQVQADPVQVRNAHDIASTCANDVAESISQKNKRSKSQYEAAYQWPNLATIYKQKFKLQQEENEQLRNQLQDRNLTVKMLNHALPMYEERCLAEKQKTATKEARIDQLLQTISGLHQGLNEEQRASLVDTRARLANVTDERDALKAELATVKPERDTATYELVTIKAKYDASNDQLATVKRELDAAKAELSTVKADQDSTRSELVMATAERNAAYRYVDSLQAELDAANARREEQETAALARYNDLAVYCTQMQRRIARYRQREQNGNTVLGALRGILPLWGIPMIRLLLRYFGQRDE